MKHTGNFSKHSVAYTKVPFRRKEKEKIYKNYRSLLDSIKKKSKKLYYSEKLLKDQRECKTGLKSHERNNRKS